MRYGARAEWLKTGDGDGDGDGLSFPLKSKHKVTCFAIPESLPG